MKFALILEPDIIDDTPKVSRLIKELRHTEGVLKLDTELADSGLLLADLAKSLDATLLERLDGIERVSGMGVKKAL